MDVAGRDVTKWLRLLLRKEGADLHRTSEFEIVREIKEKACYLTANAAKEESNDTEKVRFVVIIVIISSPCFYVAISLFYWRISVQLFFT